MREHPARCRQIGEKAAGLNGAKLLLAQLEATVQSPLDFRGALEQFLGQLGNSRLVLLHPRWPAHDPVAGQEIVASIWEETARASHVLVDLTGYNLNVCLELGMADAIGRDTLLIGAAGTPEARFPAIDKRRIHTYGADVAGQAGVRAQLAAFVKREGTLA